MAHTAVLPSKLFKMQAPTSAATLTDSARLLHVSGQVPLDSEGAVIGRGDVRMQTEQVLRNFQTLVEEVGGSMMDVFRINVYLLRREDLATIMEVRKKYFQEPYPATTVAVVAGLANPDWLVEIEGTAAV